MYTLKNIRQLEQINGGCVDNSCLQATLNFLEVCTMSEMLQINQIFKSILSSEDMINADSDTKKAALIAAIQGMTF